ncbi:MAG: VTT domain-containing protein [Planctomycetota bacterium]
MFDTILQTISDYPYIGVALVFLLCGLGFPLPEEIVLLAAGFVCAKFPDKAQLLPMVAWCAGAILIGDLIPFALGRLFGVRLLRLRWLRVFITKQRLATFDRWFRRRGDMVIVISRFVPGLRVVAFFTAGAMKMRLPRFLVLDGTGIVLIVPLLTWVGFRSAGFIEETVAKVQTIERGLLWGAFGGALLLALWIWWRRHVRQKRARKKLTETFVQPNKPVQDSEDVSESADLTRSADLDNPEDHDQPVNQADEDSGTAARPDEGGSDRGDLDPSGASEDRGGADSPPRGPKIPEPQPKHPAEIANRPSPATEPGEQTEKPA